MIARPNDRAAGIAAALGKHTVQVTQRRALDWDVVFRNGRELDARVELADDMIHLHAPIGGNDLAALLGLELMSPASLPLEKGGQEGFVETDLIDKSPLVPLFQRGMATGSVLWCLLTRNASLPPGVKLAVAVGDAMAPPVRLCGEIILDDAAEPIVRMGELCAAIKQVAHVWPATEPWPTTETPATAVDVARLCHDTSWPMVERDGAVLVELDVPEGFAQARVAAGPDGSIAAAVPIGDGPPPAPCRDALALLLLRASDSVRLVRAAAEATPRLEVALPPPVTVPALQHAFCALSVAYRLVAREATALLHDASIAATYLRHAPALTTSTVTQP